MSLLLLWPAGVSVLLETLVATCRKPLKIVPVRYGETETFTWHLHLSLGIAPGHKIPGISRTSCIWAVQVLEATKKESK